MISGSSSHMTSEFHVTPLGLCASLHPLWQETHPSVLPPQRGGSNGLEEGGGDEWGV